jgi:hypothetical protein
LAVISISTNDPIHKNSEMTKRREEEKKKEKEEERR